MNDPDYQKIEDEIGGVAVQPEKTSDELIKEERRDKRHKGLDRKKTEQWMAGPELSDTQKQLVKRTIAKDLTDDEFIIFLYRCRAYWLDPLKGEISVQVRSKNDPDKRQMVVIVQRDGYLTIAHRSGQFGGMKSGSRKEDKELVGFATVANKSASMPTEVQVYESEYNPVYGWDEARLKKDGWKHGLWVSKPRTMIQKVAESHALRRAFNISGVYEQSEVDNWVDKNPAREAESKVEKALAAKASEVKPIRNVPVGVKTKE